MQRTRNRFFWSATQCHKKLSEESLEIDMVKQYSTLPAPVITTRSSDWLHWDICFYCYDQKEVHKYVGRAREGEIRAMGKPRYKIVSGSPNIALSSTVGLHNPSCLCPVKSIFWNILRSPCGTWARIDWAETADNGHPLWHLLGGISSPAGLDLSLIKLTITDPITAAADGTKSVSLPRSRLLQRVGEDF